MVRFKLSAVSECRWQTRSCPPSLFLLYVLTSVQCALRPSECRAFGRHDKAGETLLHVVGKRVLAAMKKGWAVLVVVLFWFALGLPASADARLATECKRANKMEISGLGEQIQYLQRNAPASSGPQMPPGDCSRRLARIAGNMLYSRFDVATQNWAEQMACLELRRIYLRRSCECQGKGFEFSDAPAVVDANIEALKRIQEAQKLIGRQTIKNPAVRQFVGLVSEVRDCYSVQTLSILNSVAKELETISTSK